jgi:Sulfocyanin (SoxE) domain
MNTHRRAGLRRSAVLGLGLAMAFSSCSGPPPRHVDTQVGVTLKDFDVDLEATHVPAGNVAFNIYNRGPSTHEFLIVRTDLGAGGLPIGSDGLTVDENSAQLDLVKEDSELDIGVSRALVVDLPPGHYVFYCNLEGHYLGGMHASLVVT